MKEVIIVLPIIRKKAVLSDAEIIEQMTKDIEVLIHIGALKGTVDDIIQDFSFDKDAGYINVTTLDSNIGMTDKLTTVGAGLSPKVTYQVSEEIITDNLITVPNNGFKLFSTASIQERLRIAQRNPKMRFRYTIIDYKRFYNQKKSQLEKNPEMMKALTNMFLTDMSGMMTEILPMIEEGKQLATLVGVSQVTKGLNKVARDLSIYYRRALKAQKTAGMINKSIYQKLKDAYTEFMTELMKQVFPGAESMKDTTAVGNKVNQEVMSRQYSHTADGRIDLFSEPTFNPAELEREAEDKVTDEETRALNEEIMHYEEESQREYSASLGENTFIVVRYDAKDKDFDSYYYDLISELHPYFDKLDKLSKKQRLADKQWVITKMSDAVNFDEAVKLYKSLK